MPEMTDIDREFADLVAALQDERPEIEPGFARELDNRVAAGFPKRKRRPFAVLKRFNPAFVPSIAVAGIFAAIVVFAAIGGSGSDSDGGSGGGGGGGLTAQTATEESSGGGSGAADSAAAAPESESSRSAADPLAGGVVPPSTGAGAGSAGSPRTDNKGKRYQEHSASMTIAARPKDVAPVGDKIIGVADAVGGFVVTSSVTATDGTSGGGEFLLRVPTARLDEALTKLSRLGHVRERQQSVQDITAERTSARDRLEEYRAERRSLLRRLETADTQTEVDSLRAQLRTMNSSIASAEAALKRVDNRASFSNVSLTLVADASAAPTGDKDDSWTPGDAWKDALRVLEVAAGVLLIALAILLPLAFLVALGIAGRRLGARRARERALDAV